MGQVLLEGVEKQYPNGFKAVTDLNLEITDGEFLVMVGPSGCGKSTTLRMIAGLEEITGGTLTIGDRVVNELQPKDRDIAMVFQNYALYPHMTVYDNVAFALKLAKVPKAEIDQRVMAAARTLELDPLLERKPAQLSGGQRQRVAMGRAIVRSPEVFLLDEPLSNLDAKLRVQMRAEVTRIQAELGVTTFYVTHDQVEAMTMADRVAVIKAGILQQVDPPQKLFDEPDNLFVAAFIGSPSMNLMQGVLVDEGDENLRLGLGSHTLAIPRETLGKRPRLREYLGKPVAVGLRPKDLNDAALYPDTPPDRRFRSTITNREALGFEVIMHFDLDATPIIEAEALDLPEDMISTELGGYADVKTQHPSRVAARFDPETKAKVGDAIEVAVFVEHAHFFDPETGLAIRD